MTTGPQADIAAVLARRGDNGADYWSTPDGRLYVGSPFSTLTSLVILHELGVRATHEAAAGALTLILAACREDGHIRLAPGAPLHPCYTAEAARVLCRYGLTRDARIRRTVARLLETPDETGGWRCRFTKFGTGPETRCANPGATLFVLDVLRFFPAHRSGAVVDQAVESLLDHWEVRKPIGPCHYGMGTLFFQVEFPFLRYNLFYYVYVLSFYPHARRDRRFREAVGALQERLDPQGRVVVERPHRRLGNLSLCRKGEASLAATKRYRELRRNLST